MTCPLLTRQKDAARSAWQSYSAASAAGKSNCRRLAKARTLASAREKDTDMGNEQTSDKHLRCVKQEICDLFARYRSSDHYIVPEANKQIIYATLDAILTPRPSLAPASGE